MCVVFSGRCKQHSLSEKQTTDRHLLCPVTEGGPAPAAAPAPQRHASGSAKTGGAARHTRGPPAAAVVATTTSNGLNVMQYSTQQPAVFVPPRAASLQDQQPTAVPPSSGLQAQGVTGKAGVQPKQAAPGQHKPGHARNGTGLPKSAGPVLGVAVPGPSHVQA